MNLIIPRKETLLFLGRR